MRRTREGARQKLATQHADATQPQHEYAAHSQENGYLIVRKTQNKIQDPAKLKRLISLMDGETWLEIDADVKGDIYEDLPGVQRRRREERCRAILHASSSNISCRHPLEAHLSDGVRA